MNHRHSAKHKRATLSRRAFFGAAGGAAAGAATLAVAGAHPMVEGHRTTLPVLDDYIGRLCYNENPLGPSPLAMTAMSESISMGHRYPDWYAESLRDDLAALHGVERSQVIAGCGATEILRLCALAFADPDGNVVCPYPSYGQFAGDCAFLGTTVRLSGLDESYRIDLDDMASMVDSETTAVCITNPNNPTGPVVPATDIAAFVDSLPEHVAVIIDEAYHEYIHDPAYESAMELVRQKKNVIVIRTFSKIFGLAGIRIGYAVGESGLITSMFSWHLYATVSRVALEAARAALQDDQHINDTVTLNDQAKQYCFDAFDTLGLEYIPSETNYFMVDVDRSAAEVRAALAEQGIYVRNGWGMPQHLRVSTGTMQEMEDFVTALEDILSQGIHDSRSATITALDGNYPNPFGNATRISYRLAQAQRARLQIFDAQGRLIRTIIDSHKSPGRHALDWNGTDEKGAALASGMYYYRLTAGDFVQTRRMIRMK
jgi:histidinol-phosphate aminotransferase